MVTCAELRRLGDVNRDYIIDDKDINRLRNAFGMVKGDPNWRPEYDLNEDGKIDIRDVAVAARNFGKTCTPVITKATVTVHVVDYYTAKGIKGVNARLNGWTGITDFTGTVDFHNIFYNSPTLTLTHEKYKTRTKVVAVTVPLVELSLTLKPKEEPTERVAFQSDVAGWGGKIIESLAVHFGHIQPALLDRILEMFTGQAIDIRDAIASLEARLTEILPSMVDAIGEAVWTFAGSWLRTVIEEDKQENPERYE